MLAFVLFFNVFWALFSMGSHFVIWRDTDFRIQCLFDLCFFSHVVSFQLFDFLANNGRLKT